MIGMIAAPVAADGLGRRPHKNSLRGSKCPKGRIGVR